MRVDAAVSAIRLGAFASVLVAPFLFGAVERSIWIPLCELWIALGIISFRLTSADPSRRRSSGDPAFLALLPVHILFLIQLCPLPVFVLRFISPGSYAAYVLPDLHDGKWHPISVSIGATLEAWIYVAGLEGLFFCLSGASRDGRRRMLCAIAVASLALGAEGLWQSRSAHPDWLYARVPIFAPVGLQNSTFGPYFNRNHFATITALGAALCAGLAATRVQLERGRSLLQDQTSLAWVVSWAGASGFLLLTTAASGSRSGLLAALFGVSVVLVRKFERRHLLASLTIILGLSVALLLTGAFAIERLANSTIVASRVPAWLDIVTVLRFFPAFGSGIGAFSAAYWPYQMNVRYEVWLHAHNDYLEWIIEGGLLGLIVLFVVVRRLRRSVLIEAAGREPLLAAVSAFAVQAFFDFPARIPANAAFFVCLLALTTTRDGWRDQPTTSPGSTVGSQK